MRKAAIALIGAALLGCASGPDYYHPRKGGDAANPWGYTDYKLKEDSFFLAATYWDTAAAVRMFDRRAKELCARAGYKDFTFSRELIYTVPVAPGAVFPGQPTRPAGITREAVVTCRGK